jgi:hypothetical protein
VRIVVTHLTRVRGGYICVAGLDLETRRHVRPVLAGGPLPFDLLARYGGPFDVGRIVDLGPARPAPRPPHVEDHLVALAQVKPGDAIRGSVFWDLLQRVAKRTLRDLFGEHLKPIGRNAQGTEVGKGRASLGCLVPAAPPRLWCTEPCGSQPGRIRIALGDGQVRAIVGVTDLRLYRHDHMTPDPLGIRRAADRLAKADPVILGVGLTRPFAASRHAPREYHWLQVTNLHFAGEPVWELG